MIQTTYLTVLDLKEITAISKNVEPEQLESFIPVAEEMRIIPIIGLALDTQLKTLIETNALSGMNETLVNKIKFASAWWTFYEASTFLRTKTVNKGVVQNYADNSQVAPMEDFQSYRQSILDKATFYTNLVIDYLYANQQSFPLWANSNCNQIQVKNNYSGGIYI
jgi:hypothetical protein